MNDASLQLERQLIKATIRAHHLGDDTTAVCRAIIESGLNRGILIEELSNLDDADFMRYYQRLKKRFMD